MSVIDASAEFGKVNDPLNANPLSAGIDFTAAALNIPRPLAELRQSMERTSFGNSSFAATLVSGIGAISYIGNEGPRPAPATAPVMGNG